MAISKGDFLLGLNNALLFTEHVFFPFLKKNWKILVIILLLVVIVLLFNKVQKANSDYRNEKTQRIFEDSSYRSKLKEWSDNYKRLHVRAENLTVTNLKLTGQIDSITKLLNVKKKNITSVSTTNLGVDVKIKPKVDSVIIRVPCDNNDSLDIVQKYDIKYNDGWVNITGTVGNNEDTLSISIKNSLNRVDYWKRKWFLGRKHYYSDFNNTNPYIKVTSYKGIEVVKKPKNWGIGLSVQYGYPLNDIKLKQPVFSVGLSLQRTLIRF